MKKILLIILFVFFVVGSWFFFANRLDYKKVIFVLPSSQRASSPYFYKKDGDFYLANDLKLGFEKLGYEVEYRFREDYEDGKQEDMTDEEKRRADEYDATQGEEPIVQNQSYTEEKGKSLVKRYTRT